MTQSVDAARPAETATKRAYFRPTTADQRKVLFDVYEQTDSPRKACAAAHVGIATFYHWRPRFLVGGYAALEEPRSHAPHTFPHQLASSLVSEVVAAKEEHGDWGRRRIADELRKSHGWQAVVSASEVQRILTEAGLWRVVARDPKGVRPSSTPRGPSKRSTSTSVSCRPSMPPQARSPR
jgi:transposase